MCDNCSYKNVLRELLYEVTSKAASLRPAVERLFMRAALRWIEGFHFEAKLETPEPRAKPATAAADADAEPAPAPRPRPNNVLTALLRSILPAINKLMTKTITKTRETGNRGRDGAPGSHLTDRANTEVELRAPMALAAIKLMLHLPASMLVLRVPAVVATVCKALKRRDQRQRDDARQALVKIACRLGPAHLRVIVEQLVRAAG